MELAFGYFTIELTIKLSGNQRTVIILERNKILEKLKILILPSCSRSSVVLTIAAYLETFLLLPGMFPREIYLDVLPNPGIADDLKSMLFSFFLIGMDASGLFGSRKAFGFTPAILKFSYFRKVTLAMQPAEFL